ncbi:MAG: hypothetical protein JWM85_3614 [Acidimicrobiaceae bacterium]|nr:hypothetical protein [Acidimicrobiaceae bacterium]
MKNVYKQLNPLSFLTPFLVGFGVLGVLALLFLGVILASLLWPYTINSWLVHLGKPPVVVWWQGALLGFVPVINRLTVLAAVVTFFALLFVS